MSYHRDYGIGSLSTMVVIAIIVYILVFQPTAIVIEKSYEVEYQESQNTIQELQAKNDILSTLLEEKQVICKCSESVYSFWAGLWGFFVGALAMGYFILVGYPAMQNKIAERHKDKTKSES